MENVEIVPIIIDVTGTIEKDIETETGSLPLKNFTYKK